MSYLWDLQLSTQNTDCKTLAEFEARHRQEYSKLIGRLNAEKRKLYSGNGEGLVSTFCSGRGVFNGCCLECLVLAFQASIHARAVRVGKALGGPQCNRQHMTIEGMHERLDDNTALLAKERLAGLNKARDWERLQKR